MWSLSEAALSGFPLNWIAGMTVNFDSFHQQKKGVWIFLYPNP